MFEALFCIYWSGVRLNPKKQFLSQNRRNFLKTKNHYCNVIKDIDSITIWDYFSVVFLLSTGKWGGDISRFWLWFETSFKICSSFPISHLTIRKNLKNFPVRPVTQALKLQWYTPIEGGSGPCKVQLYYTHFNCRRIWSL